MTQKLLRAEEVAVMLSISKAYAYQLMRLNEIPAVRMGRAVRVREQDLIAFISRKTQSVSKQTDQSIIRNELTKSGGADDR